MVLHNGRIDDIGSHEELIDRQGLYFELHQLQFQHDAKPEDESEP